MSNTRRRLPIFRESTLFACVAMRCILVQQQRTVVGTIRTHHAHRPCVAARRVSGINHKVCVLRSPARQTPASISALWRVYSGRFLANSRALTRAKAALYAVIAAVFPPSFAACAASSKPSR